MVKEISSQQKIKRKIRCVKIQLVYIVLGVKRINHSRSNLKLGFLKNSGGTEFKITQSGDLVAADVDFRCI